LNDTVLNIEGLSVSFGKTEAVRDVSLSLGRGELLALVGESGSGKSVLCRTVIGLAGSGATVSYDRLDAPDRREMSLVLQDPMSSLDPAMKVGKQIEEAIPGRVPRKEKREKALELLKQAGIDDPELRARQYPSFLSGGMRQRVAVAIALAMRPRIIFADEPTTALDAPLRLRIMVLMDEARRASDVSVLFVTHDLNLVKDHADRLLIMKEGRIVESGTPSEIFAAPKEAYTKELIRYANYGERSDHHHGKIHYHEGKAHSHGGVDGHSHESADGHNREDADGHSCEGAGGRRHENSNGYHHGSGPSLASRAADAVFPVSVLRVNPGAAASIPNGLPLRESKAAYKPSPLLNAKAAHDPSSLLDAKTGCEPSPPLNAKTNHEPSPPLVDVRGLGKYYDTGRRRVHRVFDDLSFKIYEGETLGVCGPSGVGKSTLARCLAGVEKPSGGSIEVADSLNRPRAIQFIFQDSVGAFDPRVRIGDSIAEPITLAEGKKPVKERVYELMSRAELDPGLYGRYPGEISGGQRQRAGIARAISTNPKFLIADEPVSSLDVTTCVKILHLLKNIQEERSLTLMIISHDLPLLMHISDRILTLA
jgi:peptide/nickel transport system ATP-binding protein